MSVALEGLRVLVVEDDPELCNLTETILEDEGVVVRSASLGSDALELALAFEPQVALLDSRLPDTTGPELALELTRLLPACTQVLVSGDAEGVLDWQRNGGLALPKPFEIDDLVEFVRRAATRQAA